MAESASTGNSGTTSTSTSNSGAAAPGSQSSSNGSFSTGKGSSGNGNGKGNNSGNFSGGLPGLGGESWSSYNNSKGSETGAAHSSGVEGPGLQNGNFGSKWGGGGKYYISEVDGKHTIHPDANGKHSLKTDGGDGKGNYTVGSQQYMTVDEVYGKGNQSIVENQGDYEASSNEKSNVETSTFGKQDEISVTPLSVTEDKGLVDNAAIQSVEGLNFQQKDKANQEVMEAKKSRDDAESEDKSDSMRNQLKAVAEKDAEEDNNTFQVGEKNTFEEQDKAKLDQLNQKNQELENAKNKEKDAIVAAEEAEAIAKKADKAVEEALSLENRVKQLAAKQAEKLGDCVFSKDDSFAERFTKIAKGSFLGADLKESRQELESLAKDLNVDLGDVAKSVGIENISKETTPTKLAKVHGELAKVVAEKVAAEKDNQQKAQEAAKSARTHATELTTKVQEAQANYEKAEQEYTTWKAEYWANAEKTKAEEEAAAKKAEEEAVTTEAPSYKANIKAARDEINNSKDLTDEQKAEANTVLGNVESAADAMNEAANALAKNPNDINAVQQYVEETARYNKALKDAKGNKTLKNTDFNKTFTRAVAGANDFMVTRDDGTQQSYAEFAAEMATKSPELAKGLYEAKAKNYEENGHKVLAAIETAKSKMVMTWLGSKFTFADNQVRSQFNQMAKTDMRATYATYNNVLNDETGKYSEADKAEASAAINQANSLMTASAALQASTGFFSGIGDETSDGVYGVTDPGKLNAYQKTLSVASNLAKVVLGLGVTPGANEAYQDMYYLAGAKVNESGLYSKDFDGDGFALCQEYGNNAAVGMIAGAGELATAVALTFNPATSKLGLNLAIDAVQTFFDALYGIQNEVNKSIKYSEEILKYFGEAKSIAAETGNEEVINAMDNTIDGAVKKIEDFQIKSDEVGNLDNWLEGSGSNTADNGKFNQALSYDEWLKLIEADPVMQEYAKSLNR